MQTLLTLLALVAIVAFYGWYEYEHPCIRSETVWVPPQVDLLSQADGTSVPVMTPGQWHQVCLERTTRLP